MTPDNFAWIDVALELGVMPEVITDHELDPNGNQIKTVRNKPMFNTKAESEKWHRQHDKAADWAGFVLQMLHDGLDYDKAIFIAKQCLSVNQTVKQGQAVYNRAVKSALKDIKKQRKNDAIPKPEAYGDWA